MEIAFVLVLLGLIVYFLSQRHDSSLDQHPPVVIPMRYPLVYDAVIKAIKTFSYEDYSWFIAYADPDQGYIQAKCRFREEVTSHLRSERRAIDLDLQLRQLDGESTEMIYSFSVFSPYGRVEAAHIIWAMELSLQCQLIDLSNTH